MVNALSHIKLQTKDSRAVCRKREGKISSPSSLGRIQSRQMKIAIIGRRRTANEHIMLAASFSKLLFS